MLSEWSRVSVIMCCLEIHWKAAQPSLPDLEGLASSTLCLWRRCRRASTALFSGWILHEASHFLWPKMISVLWHSGWCALTAGTWWAVVWSSLFSDMLPYWLSPEWSHCPADVGCNTSWITFFHCSKNAAAVNRHSIAGTGMGNNLVGDWTVHLSSYKRGRGWKKGANKNDWEAVRRWTRRKTDCRLLMFVVGQQSITSLPTNWHTCFF